jgi:hypothetical protein
MRTSHPEIGKEIAENGVITPDTEEELRQALATFMSTWN